MGMQSTYPSTESNVALAIFFESQVQENAED